MALSAEEREKLGLARYGLSGSQDSSFHHYPQDSERRATSIVIDGGTATVRKADGSMHIIDASKLHGEHLNPKIEVTVVPKK